MDTVEPQVKQNQNQIIDLINRSNDLDTLKKIRSAITKVLWEEAKVEIDRVSSEKNITPKKIKAVTGIEID